MPIDNIQFRPGLSLLEFFGRFHTEALGEAALEQARWPNGFVYPDCGEYQHSLVHRGDKKALAAYQLPQANLADGTDDL